MKFPPCAHRGETKGNQCRCNLAPPTVLLSAHACTMCQSNLIQIPKSNQSRGLGDTIAKFTDRIGIPKCAGCGKRQGFFNKMVPYKSKPS